jgi:hypothetical protein
VVREHQYLPCANDDVVVDSLPVQDRSALGINVEAVAEPATDFADSHVRDGDSLPMRAGSNKHKLRVRRFVIVEDAADTAA